jgi:hypothetical protein
MVDELTSLNNLQTSIQINQQLTNENLESLYQNITQIINSVDLAALERASIELIEDQLYSSGFLNKINSTNKEVEQLLENIKFFGEKDSGFLNTIKNTAAGFFSSDFSDEDKIK